MNEEIVRLEWLLSKLQLMDPPYHESAEGKKLYQEICELVLGDQLYRHIWSEPILNQLQQLFQTEKPDPGLFEAEVDEILKRTRAVAEINDCFFGIVDPSATTEDLCEFLAKLQSLTLT